MLGRFLEISIHAPDVAASLAFYEALGFVSWPVGDTWTHAYGVVSDGRVVLGLHAYPFASPALTFVRPGLAGHAPGLAALGIEFAFAKLGEDRFHELGFLDPSGQMVTLLEARTFSPPGMAATATDSLLGHFEEVGLPASDPAALATFWAGLGAVVFAASGGPLRRTPLQLQGLALAAYELPLAAPVLTFSAAGHATRVARLRAAGFSLETRLPRGLAPADAALLVAPEGTQLLLVREVGEDAAPAIEVLEG